MADFSTEKGKCWKTIRLPGSPTCEKLAIFSHCRNCPEFVAAGRSLLDREIPGGFLEEWSEELARQKPPEAEDLVSVIIFRLREELLALKTVFFKGIAELRMIRSLPSRTGKNLLGLVNIEGKLTPCVAVHSIIGIDEEGRENDPPPKRPRFAVIEKDGAFVFPVDEVLGIFKIASSELVEVPATLAKSHTTFTSSLFYIQGKNVGLLEEEKFFQALQRSLVS